MTQFRGDDWPKYGTAGSAMTVAEIAEYYHRIVMESPPGEYDEVASWASAMVKEIANDDE